MTYVTAEADDPVPIIAEAAGEHDYVILGASQHSWLKRRFFGSKPVQIAELIDVPVALIRPRTPLLGFGLRRILNYVRGGYREVVLNCRPPSVLRVPFLFRPVSVGYNGPRWFCRNGWI